MRNLNFSEERTTKLVNALISRGFGKRDAALQSASDHLFREAYLRMYTPEEHELIAKLPADALRRTSSLRLKARRKTATGEQSVECTVSVGSCGNTLPMFQRNFGDTYNGFPSVYVDEMYGELALHDAVRCKLEQDKKEEKARLRGLFRACKGTNKLISVWPEVEQIVRDTFAMELAEPASNLPALVINDMNTFYGLPPTVSEDPKPAPEGTLVPGGAVEAQLAVRVADEDDGDYA